MSPTEKPGIIPYSKTEVQKNVPSDFEFPEIFNQENFDQVQSFVEQEIDKGNGRVSFRFNDGENPFKVRLQFGKFGETGPGVYLAKGSETTQDTENKLKNLHAQLQKYYDQRRKQLNKESAQS